MLDLARTAWRYELGYISEQEAGAVVEAEVNRLIEEIGSQAKRTMGLIHRPSELIRRCDEGINSALGHRLGTRFKEAVAEIKIVRDALEGIRRFTAAHEAYEASRGAYRRIEFLIDSEYLLQNTSINVLSELLSEVENLLKTAEYRQAQTIGRMCNQWALALEAAEPRRDINAGGLLERVERFSEFSGHNEGFAVATDSTINQACEALRSIIERGYVVLAKRLIEDIEIDLAPRQTLVAEYERHIRMFSIRAGEEVIPAERLNNMVIQTSCMVATDFLLEKALKAVSSDLDRLDKYIASIHSAPVPPKSFEVEGFERVEISDPHAGGVEQ